MIEESYVITSLDDEKAKEIGQIIANPTSRRILNMLAEKNATETDISAELKLPLSTVSYNIQQLLKSGMIEIKNFYYSSKGNKINVYTLARKIILIAPKNVEIKRSKLRSLIQAVFVSFAISIFIKIFFGNIYTMREAAIEETAAGLKEAAAEISQPLATRLAAGTRIGTTYAFFFFIGSVLTLLIFLAIEKIKNEKIKKIQNHSRRKWQK